MPDDQTAKFLQAVIRGNCGAWFESYGRIWGRDRTKGVIKPRQNYLQHKIQQVVDKFEELELPVRIIGLKPRQRGSTTYFTALGYTLMRRTSTSAVFIGGQSDQTVGLWTMMKTYHKNDAFNWGNAGDVNEKGATFTNGSRAKKETAKDVQAGIGDTYTLLHATEAARWSRYGVANASAVMSNILKAVPTSPHTYIFLESSAEQAAGDFYERWTEAVDADDFISGAADIKQGGYCRVFAPWFEFQESTLPSPITPQERRDIENTLDAEAWYEGEQELLRNYGKHGEDGVLRLGSVVVGVDWIDQLAWRRYAIINECERDKNIFDRDFPHSWQTAFQKSGALKFNATGISVIKARIGQKKPEQGVLEETPTRAVAFRKSDPAEAKVTIFERPEDRRKYILAIDPMTGASQTTGADPDFHGVFVLRAGYWGAGGKWVRPCTAARIVPCRWDIDVLESAVWRLARYYGSASGCMIAIEVNQDRGLIELLKARNANLYRREVFNQLEFKTSKAYGYQTTSKTRENLIDTLAKAIRECDTPGEGIDIWCPHAVSQLENFITKPNGRSEAADNHHDDDIFSIALGLELIDHATTYVADRGIMGMPPDLRLPTGAGNVPSAFS